MMSLIESCALSEPQTGILRHGIPEFLSTRAQNNAQNFKNQWLESVGFPDASTSLWVAFFRNASSPSSPIARSAMHNVFSRAFAPRITATSDLGTLKIYIAHQYLCIDRLDTIFRTPANT